MQQLHMHKSEQVFACETPFRQDTLAVTSAGPYCWCSKYAQEIHHFDYGLTGAGRLAYDTLKHEPVRAIPYLLARGIL